jgi:hypothetical protein
MRRGVEVRLGLGDWDRLMAVISLCAEPPRAALLPDVLCQLSDRSRWRCRAFPVVGSRMRKIGGFSPGDHLAGRANLVGRR